jgi:hypothetical protein
MDARTILSNGRTVEENGDGTVRIHFLGPSILSNISVEPSDLSTVRSRLHSLDQPRIPERGKYRHQTRPGQTGPNKCGRIQKPATCNLQPSNLQAEFRL